MKAVIFDIDGTLADATHRMHHVTGSNRNWDAFSREAEHDTPHEAICDLYQMVRHYGWPVILVSGRPESIRDLTEDWLKRHGVEGYSALHMRPEGDYRPDYMVKSQILDAVLAEGYEIAFTVDDRPSVVAMWRERGIVCLQCRDWNERKPTASALLTLMVGPSGAGKSTWLSSEAVVQYGIHQSHILSSDQFRHDLCGDFRDQTKNDEVFAALHAIAKARLSHGLPTVIDATNLRRKNRLAAAALNGSGPVRYIVIDRKMEEKRRDAGWRTELPIDLLAKHAQTFGSQAKDIVAGDHQTNVTVIDLRGPP